MQARLRVKGSSGTAKKSSCTASKNSSACCEQERPGVGSRDIGLDLKMER